MKPLTIIAAALTLVGCAAGPVATPHPTPATSPPASQAARAGITSAVLGLILEEHFGEAFALTGSDQGRVEIEPTGWVDGVSASAHYRATPSQPAWGVMVGYVPQPFPGCAGNRCTEYDGVVLRENSHLGTDLIAPRDQGYVYAAPNTPQVPDELLDTYLALLRDPRIDATTDGGLLAPAQANPRWRAAEFGCGDRPVGDVLPLAVAMDGERTEPPTPQALAALVASRVAGGCAGGPQNGFGDRFGRVYLGNSEEWVQLEVIPAAEHRGCSDLDLCEHHDGIDIGWTLDVPEEHPAQIRLVRQADDGWVVVEHTTFGVDERTRKFRVSLDVLRALVTDPRVGMLVDPALNRAGDELGLPWELPWFG